MGNKWVKLALNATAAYFGSNLGNKYIDQGLLGSIGGAAAGLFAVGMITSKLG